MMASASTQSRLWTAVDYNVACICPTGDELAAVTAMLDRTHLGLPAQRDQNSYTLGEMAGHNVVVAVLPEIGTNAAATVAVQLLNDFPAIRFGLLVGTGGGVPDDEAEDADGNDIRLGDVVVSKPVGSFGGVVQYDLGKYTTGEGWERTGTLNKPPALLRSKVEQLAAGHRMRGSQISSLVVAMLNKYDAMKDEYAYPGSENDLLFRIDYKHARGRSCRDCDRQCLVDRDPRHSQHPKVHYGNIGSANVVVKDATLRDKLRRDMNILCIEMEAAGLMNDFPCLVIRGISDYADSHKTKQWRPYAAAVAAAYMKELLSIILPKETNGLTPAVNMVQISRYGRGLNLFDAPDTTERLFVGRKEELVKMQNILQPGGDHVGRTVLVLGGLGGMGKTQLAITYAKQHRSHYTSIFWLNASSESTLQHSFYSIARCAFGFNVVSGWKMDHEQVCAAVLEWLSEVDNTRWLLIFDNYDDLDLYRLDAYYPFTSQGTIVVTSRLPDQVGHQQVLLKSLVSVEDGLEILRQRSEREHVHEDIYARRLAKRLDGLPLALVTAGAFLRKSVWSFQQYLQVYEERWNVSPRRAPHLLEYRDRTLYTTWDLSYAQLEKRDPDAACLLQLLAYFDYHAIWYELFRAGAETEMGTKNTLPGWLIAMARDPLEFEGLMQILVEYCLLEVQLTTQTYSLHTCVYDWICAGLNMNVEPWCYLYAFDCVAGLVKNEDWTTLGHLEYNQLLPHAVRLTHSKFGEIDDETLGKCLSGVEDVAQLLQKQVQLVAAEQMYLRALAGKENVLGAEHTSTLQTVNNLGILYTRQGKLAEAEQMYLRALAGLEKALGAEHTSTLNTVNNLGILYADQGKLVEAEQMYLRALARKEKVLGAEHTSTLQTVNNLGALYAMQGKLVEAEQICLRALAGLEKALGAEHTSTLDTVHNLGILYTRQGKLAEAEQMYLRALAGLEKALGAEHTSTLNTVNNLGILYADQGKLVEAEQMYLRALARKEKVLGAEHTSTLQTVNNLSILYARQGKLVEAEYMLLRVLAGEEKVLDTEHTSTLDTVHNLGNLYAMQGRLVEAEQMYLRALAGLEKALGAEHTSTLNTACNLCLLYAKQGRLVEAEKLYEKYQLEGAGKQH